MADFVVTCTLTVGGVTLDLNAGAYQLEAGTRNEMGMTWRKEEVNNPFIEGSYLISAVRENVMETVNVYVRGIDHQAMDKAVQALLAAVENPRYTIAYGHTGITETWSCQTAQYSVGTQREYQLVNLALVKLQIPRLPRVTRAYGDGTMVTR